MFCQIPVTCNKIIIYKNVCLCVFNCLMSMKQKRRVNIITVSK